MIINKLLIKEYSSMMRESIRQFNEETDIGKCRMHLTNIRDLAAEIVRLSEENRKELEN